MKEKIDLTLIKRLVAELETSLDASEEHFKNKSDLFAVEMHKATGLAGGIMSEAVLLVGDIQNTLLNNTKGPAPSNEILTKILGGLKGPGNIN